MDPIPTANPPAGADPKSKPSRKIKSSVIPRPIVHTHDGEYKDNDGWYDVEHDPDEAKMKADDIKDPEWQWLAYDEVQEQSGENEVFEDDQEWSASWEGKSLPSHLQCFWKELWPDKVQIKIKSPYLMEVLRKVTTRDRGFHHMEKAEVPGRELYVLMDDLAKFEFNNDHQYDNGTAESRDGITEVPEVDSNFRAPDVSIGQVHLNHLRRFLEQEYREVPFRHQHMKQEKSVSFDMLWTFLKPGRKVIYTCNHTQEPLCGTVASNAYRVTQCGLIFSVDLNVFDYNGESYRRCQIKRDIGYFTGDRPFEWLEAWPVQMDSRPVEVLEAEFISRGRKFEELAIKSKNRFMQYRGPIFTVSRQEILKENADGRAMIDIHSFAKMNSNYPMRTAQPPVVHGTDAEHFEKMPPRKQLIRRCGNAPPQQFVSDDAEVAASRGCAMRYIPDEDIQFAPAIVYGFSFALKKWGAFAVSGFSEISFATNAFDSLVMETELKELVHSLVSQYTTKIASTGESAVRRVDPIANKGEGCIFLCYGPPGTGKTLTAESIAENLRRPLWSLSVSELGTTPGELEKTLVKTFNVAAEWQAVVLLDEADVYLEKRSSSVDLTRNAMTGIFLRLLEYFRGVLFLTSNRITTFDEAFSSRISLVLSYPPLQVEQREQIWKTSLERVQLKDASPGFLAQISKQEINGREIRTAIQTAQTFSKSRDEVLQEKHVAFVMKIMATSKSTMAAALLARASS